MQFEFGSVITINRNNCKKINCLATFFETLEFFIEISGYFYNLQTVKCFSKKSVT